MATRSSKGNPERGLNQNISPAIRAAMARLGLPMAVFDLALGRLLAVNETFERLMDVAASSIVGLSMSELLTRFQPVETREESLHHFNEVVAHRLMGFQAARHFISADGRDFDAQIWMRRLDLGDGRDLAANIIVPLDRALGEPVAQPIYATEASPPALVVTDHDWRVEHSSSDVLEILGYHEMTFVGVPLLGLVQPTDAPDFLLAVTQAAASHQTTIARARLRTAAGEWTETVCFVTPLCAHDPPRLGVMMATRASAAAFNASADSAKLEQHLWKIGLEVRAAGFLPEVSRELAGELPREFAELSSRQWEIVTRLLRGERAPDIAKAMFLSPTTVRNHLTAVFRKFGVHSQTQLLVKLRNASFRSPSALR